MDLKEIIMEVKFEDIPRKDLELFIYEEHKTAFGVKGRHYDFESMTMEEIRAEAQYIADACDRAYKEEAEMLERDIASLEEEIATVISYGAGDRETALRWMTDGETFYHGQCVEHWVWNKGVLFSDYGRKLVKELADIVKFTDMEYA
ncbi:MAG: hypothetical protein EBY41_00635 [Proteobacteria bacterium]|nr:hypothetical protein [Pseudomonadota bacterium]